MSMVYRVMGDKYFWKDTIEEKVGDRYNHRGRAHRHGVTWIRI